MGSSLDSWGGTNEQQVSQQRELLLTLGLMRDYSHPVNYSELALALFKGLATFYSSACICNNTWEEEEEEQGKKMRDVRWMDVRGSRLGFG